MLHYIPKHDGPILVTVKTLVQMPQYTFLTQNALRHLIFQASPRMNSKGETISGNGLDQAIIRKGRRVLIDVEKFDAWLAEKQF